MRCFGLCLLVLASACHDYENFYVTETTYALPIVDGTKLLVGGHFRHSRLDKNGDPDDSPTTVEENATLFQMTPAGQVLWQQQVEGALEIRWIGRIADRNIVIASAAQNWLARAYDDTGKSLWTTELPEDAVARLISRGAVGIDQQDATAVAEGDHIRIVRFHAPTLRLELDGALSSEPAAWPPPGLDVEPPGFGGTILPLVDGGAVVYGRPTVDRTTDARTLVARYDDQGALRWSKIVELIVRDAVLRNDGALAVTGFGSDSPFDASDPRYLVLDDTGETIVDASLEGAPTQVTEWMTPDGPDGVLLHGRAAGYDPTAMHMHTLQLDGNGAIVSHVDTPLPWMITYDFDAAGRMGYADVLQPDAGVGELDALGRPRV